MTDQGRLEPLPEDWQRALAIVAHPDDLEYGTAAAVARWTGQGKQIAYCLASSGEAGIDSLAPEQAGPLREREQLAAAAEVGVETVEFLGFPDGMIEYGLPLRGALARAIRRHRPEIVITLNFRDIWGEGGPLNQADHVATGRAVLDAVNDAGNRWLFRDEPEPLPPWPEVRQVWVASSPLPGYGVDVTDTFAQGLASLRAHEAYLRGLGPDALPETIGFLTEHARSVGDRLGCRYGVAFEVFPRR